MFLIREQRENLDFDTNITLICSLCTGDLNTDLSSSVIMQQGVTKQEIQVFGGGKRCYTLTSYFLATAWIECADICSFSLQHQ